MDFVGKWERSVEEIRIHYMDKEIYFHGGYGV